MNEFYWLLTGVTFPNAESLCDGGVGVGVLLLEAVNRVYII